MTTDLCWCGSGKAYADCHSEIDAKIELYRKACLLYTSDAADEL